MFDLDVSKASVSKFSFELDTRETIKSQLNAIFVNSHSTETFGFELR